MKLKAFMGISVLASSIAGATEVHYGYAAYYSSQPGAIFSTQEKYALQPFSRAPATNIKLSWQGMAAGKKHRVAVDNGNVWIDGLTLRLRSARPFPSETIDAGDLGIGTEVYFSHAYTCLEAVPPSASGSAVRHKSVYLIGNRRKPILFIKLPSLFASCTGIRLDRQGAVSFDKVTYRYQAGGDRPTGVTFTEYGYDGKRFVASGRIVQGTFFEPGNVYRFAIEDPM